MTLSHKLHFTLKSVICSMVAPFISSHPHLPPLSLSPPPLHIHPLFRLSQIDQIFALLGPRPVYFLECVFSSGRACAVAQQCRLRHASVWLSGWGRRLGRVWGCECACNVGCSPFAGQTGPVSLTHCSHSLSQHTQDRVWIVWRPVAMPGMLSPSSSLGKNAIWFSVCLSLSLSPSLPLKGCSSLMRGITRCISRPVSSFLQIPAWPVREGLPARGILRRATAFHIGIS